jgi:hypothetical protein
VHPRSEPLFFLLEQIIIHVNKEQEKSREKLMDKSTGLEMEQVSEPESLLDWIADKYKEFGANLEFVTNRSQEGAQFVKGFGGIGGILRYKVDLQTLTSVDEEEEEFYSDNDDGGIWRYCWLFGAPSIKGTPGGADGRGGGGVVSGVYDDVVGIVDGYDLAREDRKASMKTKNYVQQVGIGGSLDSVVKDM